MTNQSVGNFSKKCNDNELSIRIIRLEEDYMDNPDQSVFGLWCWRLNCCAWAHRQPRRKSSMWRFGGRHGLVLLSKFIEYTWQLVNFLLLTGCPRWLSLLVIQQQQSSGKKLKPSEYSCSWSDFTWRFSGYQKQVRVGKIRWLEHRWQYNQISIVKRPILDQICKWKFGLSQICSPVSRVLYRPVWLREYETYVPWSEKSISDLSCTHYPSWTHYPKCNGALRSN